MKRRDLLVAGSTGLLLGSSGCLGSLDGTNDGGSNEPIDLDCEPYKGKFGILTVGVPVAVPDDAAVIDIEEMGIIEYDAIEAEMEHARETRSEAEDRISEIDEEGEMQQTGSVKLGNGDRYANVKESLNEYESIETVGLSPKWYVTYQGDVYGLSLGASPLPFELGIGYDYDATKHAWINIYAVESVPDDAVVIDAVETDLNEHEHLGEVLTIAGCSDEIEGIPRWEENQIAERYYIPPDEYETVRDLLGESKEHGHSWYVGYDAEVYRLTLGQSVSD
ncbi:membrane lipoprotein [Halorhabdus tiamatea SARL4B]|uniref:Membrane lipoprotein n=1 Tax=Halorhabdus tiamatea SARL4B TaxID=1033806 RepID=F7PFN1_9EURY|nr:hypothetical protein [Halorhabdus tiamatea]ERJ06450.1 membrane lipoprotein [Halorhabdus tiamatea SARL4B]CCQ34310.1 hypothetical protein HTIA_2198 [Halorhabdus tiamatea SARL4B]